MAGDTDVSCLVSTGAASLAVFPAALDSVFLVVTGAFNCAEAGSMAALDEDFSTCRLALPGLAVAVSGLGVDARFAGDDVPAEDAVAARKTAFGALAPTLSAGVPGAVWASVAGAAWCFTGFFIAFAMESKPTVCGLAPYIRLIAYRAKVQRYGIS
jgi:hypothetical protein